MIATLTLPEQRGIRSFVLRQGRVSNAQRRSLDILLPVYGVLYTPAALDLNAVFGRTAPKILEIGFGMGETTAYALYYLQDRGLLMLDPQTKVYEGMIVGQHTRDNDLIVNVVQGKKLTNIRSAGKDEALTMTPPMRMTLERAMSYIEEDELVEITPKSIRLRKKWLDENERKKQSRKKEAVEG